MRQHGRLRLLGNEPVPQPAGEERTEEEWRDLHAWAQRYTAEQHTFFEQLSRVVIGARDQALEPTTDPVWATQLEEAIDLVLSVGGDDLCRFFEEGASTEGEPARPWREQRRGQAAEERP